MKITKDMLIVDALKLGNTSAMADVLYNFGMHCIGCILAHNETIEQAAHAHGVDVDAMVVALNEACDKLE